MEHEYYIHLKKENYIEYGIGEKEAIQKPSDSLFEGYKKIVQARKQSVYDKFGGVDKDALAKQLEAYYQNVYYGNLNTGFLSEVESVFNEMLSPDSIVEKENLLKTSTVNDTTYSQFQKQCQLKSDDLIDFLTQKQKITVQKLNIIIQKLQSLLENENVNQRLASEEGRVFIKEDFAKALNALKELAQSASDDGKTYIFFNSLEEKSGMNWETFKECAKFFTRNSSIISVNQGRVGEWSAAIVNLCKDYGANKITEKTLKQEIKSIISKNVVGSKYNYVTYNENTGLTNDDPEQIDIAIKAGKNLNIKIKGHVSKVDVILEWTDEEGKIKNIPLSVKNYNSFKDLTIVDGTPLSTILTYIGGNPHVYHVLNVYTHANELSEWKNTIDEYVYEYAVITALTGYSIEKMPEMFLVFNNAAKKVRCYNVASLLKKLFDKNEKEYTYKVEGIKMQFVPSDNDGTLKDQVQARQRQIFQAYNAIKVAVHINLASEMTYGLDIN